MNQIKINNLTKIYNQKIVLNNINFVINNNKINFIVGANGCGKSTLIKCILDLITYKGTIFKSGKISYAPEKIFLPNNLCVDKFFELIIKIKGINNLSYYNYLLDLFHLRIHLYKNIYELSLGTKQKIILIQALIEDSDVYIFDEPLNGLDDNSMESFIGEIIKLNGSGKLVIIVSHDYKRFKFDDICKILLDNGEIVDKFN